MGAAHSWRRDDDVVAFYLSRFGESLVSTKEAAARLGIKPGSMRMRVSNFRALAGAPGLNHASEQSRSVHAEFNTKSQSTVESEVRRILDLTRSE